MKWQNYTIFYQLPFTGTIARKIPARCTEQAIKRCRSLSDKKMLILSVFDEDGNRCYYWKEDSEYGINKKIL